MADALDVLSFYRRHFRDECDVARSLANASDLIDQFGVVRVAKATARVIATKPSPRMAAEYFFSDFVFRGYLEYSSHSGSPVAAREN